MDLRMTEEFANSVAGLRKSIAESELEGKDGILKGLDQMVKNWKRIKAILSDWENERRVKEAAKEWLVELRDLAWEIEHLVDLHDYHVLAIQADEEVEEEEKDDDLVTSKKEEQKEPGPCDDLDTPYLLDSPYLLEEDFEFGRWEPERWCSKTLFDRAKANGKWTEVSFGYKQNEVCLPQASTTAPILDLRCFVKQSFKKQSPRKVFIRKDGDDRWTKVTCCFYKDGHHIHLQKSLSIVDPVASRKWKEREFDLNVRDQRALPSPAPLDPSLLKEISDGARKINERFRQIAKAHCRLSNLKQRVLNSDDVRSILNWQALPSGSVPANPDRFFGRDKQMQEIVEMLISVYDNPMKPEVIAVVGMGGIGKTTLCQHIYDHPQINEHFDLRGWIHVGESFHVIRVANNILNSFTKKCDKYDQPSIIQEELKKQVLGKRFLLVMDDVWSESRGEWEPVLTPLLSKGGSSKILVTTRSHGVAEAAGALKSIPLDLLSEKDAWCLFRKYANVDDSQEQLVEIGKGIVAKCKGLPLAIKVMGSLMRNKRDDLDSWREILDSDFSDLNEGEGGGGGNREILGSLYLSYLHLPSHLKACFRFFNFLDKGLYYYERGVEILTDFWLAHDLIGDHKGKTWYWKQGRKIIDDFASRSFLDIDSISEEIRVHDLVFDLAKYVSGTEFCLKHILSDEDIRSWTPPTAARHLSFLIRLGMEEHLLKKSILNGVVAVRTIKLTKEEHWETCSRYLPDLNQHANLRFLWTEGITLDIDFHLKHLRVLCIEWTDIKVIPKSLYTLYNLIKLHFSYCHGIKRVSNLIGNLKNLQCLSFRSCCRLRSIPESVSKLSSLEELNLSECHDLAELPAGITRLVNLYSLDISDTGITWMPLGISNLRKLNRLPSYPLGYGNLHHQLNDLNSLNLKGESLDIIVHDYLAGKESELAGLGINGQFHKMSISFSGRSKDRKILYDDILLNDEQILQYLRPHTNIRELTISFPCSRLLPIWMGDQSFNQLVSLELRYLKYYKTLSPIHKLPSLRRLYFDGLHASANLFWVKESEVITGGKNLQPHQKSSCFPKLEELTIANCDNMKLLPIYHLTALQTLSISNCPTLKSIEFVDPSSLIMEEHHDRSNSSSHITKLSLEYCSAMEYLPIYQLPFLLTLFVRSCEKLKSIEFVDPSFIMEEHHDRGNSSLLITELRILGCDELCFSSNRVPPQSLEKVVIWECEKLESWFHSQANSKWKDVIHGI